MGDGGVFAMLTGMGPAAGMIAGRLGITEEKLDKNNEQQMSNAKVEIGNAVESAVEVSVLKGSLQGRPITMLFAIGPVPESTK